MGAELFHAGVRTDMTLIVAFRNFANAHKNSVWRAGSPTDNQNQVFRRRVYTVTITPDPLSQRDSKV
jgi:hypothetical protein